MTKSEDNNLMKNLPNSLGSTTTILSRAYRDLCIGSIGKTKTCKVIHEFLQKKQYLIKY